jgi:hypothetical protein
MGKDPAVLWYWGDWSGGTRTYSRFLKGCYMDLLEAQFNSGPLSLEEIRTVLGNDFAAWGSLSKKFAQDATGKFFNERMEREKAKRRSFTKSRIENLKGKPHMAPHMDTHMDDHMENENRIKTSNKNSKKGVQGEKTETAEITHPLQIWIRDALPTVSKLRDQLTFKEAEELVSKAEKKTIQSVLEAMENYAQLLKKYKSVFLTAKSWIKKEQLNPQQNGKPSYQQATADFHARRNAEHLRDIHGGT